MLFFDGADGNAQLFGNDGDDEVFGGPGGDAMSGGGGDDFGLLGEPGDQVVGGQGYVTAGKQGHYSGVRGITADTVVEVAMKEFGIETVQRQIDRTELYIADEVFMTGTAAQPCAAFSVWVLLRAGASSAANRL